MDPKIGKSTTKILITWPFLLSLVILLANDWWFKLAFPGVITGKLSDFAGVAIIGLLLFASRLDRKLIIYVLVSGIFFWWKSPFSETFINIFNELSPLGINRVIDYGDLIALTILPVCQYITEHQSRFTIRSFESRKIINPLLSLITALAVMGTSANITKLVDSVHHRALVFV